jgi:hypothetical protein
VEAAETLFHPVAVRNNVDGFEKLVLERFEEPSWNNPVLRFLDAKGVDVIPRKDRIWTTGGVLGRMVEALEAAEQTVPPWLALTATETSSGEVETAVFAMT